MTDSNPLLCTNVGARHVREKGQLLIIGTCMLTQYPEIVEAFAQKDGGYAVLNICLEDAHVNQAGFKIASFVRYSQLKRVVALSVDGSPHCVQLHFVTEDVKRHFVPELEVEHYVVEHGRVHKISPDAVKKGRHLSKIQKMLNSE
ncbi:MAG: 4Fe-4S ferredoxin [Candidatus Lokiarchaeota archaeon]|nr:4Fe-4S ferredoxin [Candidatus Lokiarchaeota archaeon]